MVVFTGANRGDNARGDLGRIDLPRVPFPPPTVVPFDPAIWDANPSTFYSAMSNIDVEIGDGNPAATAIRFRCAQHCFLSNMDFQLGSAFAGIYQAGNVVHNLHFHGGRYGIVTEKTSPAWQFTVIDSTFEGQKSAAIREHEAQLTLVNAVMRDVPVGIEIDRGYSDQLWGKDVRFENVRRAAVVISNERSVNTKIGFDNALASNTPVFAQFRDSGRTVRGKGPIYRVSDFGHGVTVPGFGQAGRIETHQDIVALRALPPQRPAAIRSLPPVKEWRNAHDLGAVGDGQTDDTVALQRAIDAHRVIYLPLGIYKVTDTIRLRSDSVLVALHPSRTQIALADGTAAFQGVGEPKALVQSAQGGDAIVSGVGLFTGGINPRATALLWRAGASSLVEDVRFEGGHGADPATGSRLGAYNPNHSGDPDPARRWDGQYPSLWVTQGGGGTFNGIWTPNTYASAGFYVSDTSTPGHVYEMSIEHHVRNEIVLNRVAHWEFLAPQTEEEYGEGRNAVSLEIRDSSDILIANYHAYRVTRTLGPAPAAVRLYGEIRNVRFRNVHVNGESGFATCDGDDCATFLRLTKYPFENSIEDVTHGLLVREREFARLDVSGTAAQAVAAALPSGAAVTRLAGGFEVIGGGAIDSKGTLYFVDRIAQRIYAWSQASGLRIVRSQPLDAVNLAVDASDNLLVLSSFGYEGAVYSLKPDGLDGALTRIDPTPARTHPDAAIIVPANWWVNGEFRDQYDPPRDEFATLAELFARDRSTGPDREYASPDGSVVLPAFRVFHQGPPDQRGWRFSHSLDTYGFTSAKPGARIHAINASEARTYLATLGPKGVLRDLKVFAERGGESVATDAVGRVYVANGQIFVYASSGDALGTIDVPDRPLQLLVGGTSPQTLFILTHHALYSVNLAQADK